MPRNLKSISSFMACLGSVDAVMGGVGGYWTLLSLGLTVLGMAAFVRWWKLEKTPSSIGTAKVKYLLPPSSSHPLLPLLTRRKLG